MSGDNSETQLPTEVKPVFELTVATTNVTKARIEELTKEAAELPKEDNDENVVLWRAHRKDLKSIRSDAKAYIIRLKAEIKQLSSDVMDDWEELEKVLLKLEGASDTLIKEHEKVVTERRAAKKKEKEEKAAALKKIDDEIQALGNVPVQFIKSSSEEILEEITRLEEMDLTEEEFSDRVEEAELKRELSVENLKELLDGAVEKEKAKAELKKSQDELAEKKKVDQERADAEAKKLEDEEVEKKRISDIKDLIKVFDEFIVEAAVLTTSEELQRKIDFVEAHPVTDEIYFEFLEVASAKKQSVVNTIRMLMDGKLLIESAAETAQAQKDKIAQDTKDLADREEKLRLDQKKLDDDRVAAEEVEPHDEEDPAELDSDVEPSKTPTPKELDSYINKHGSVVVVDDEVVETASEWLERLTGGKMVRPSEPLTIVLSLKVHAQDYGDSFPDNLSEEIIEVCDIAIEFLK